MGRDQSSKHENVSRMLRDGISDTFVSVKTALIPVELEARKRHLESMMDEWEIPLGKRVAEMLAPIFAIEGDIGPFNVLRDLCDKPVNQVDFLVELVGSFVGILSVGGTVGGIVFQGLFNSIASQHREVPLPPALCADAVIRGIMTEKVGDSEAANSGTSTAAFQNMLSLAGETIGIEEALSLFRKGAIDQPTLYDIFGYSRLNPKWYDAAFALINSPMSGADAIEAYIKGQMSHDDATVNFGIAGNDPSQFDVLAATAGNPIGVDQALNLYNHGLISDADVGNVILHSRINPQFEAMAKLLRFKFLSPYQIVSALKAGDCTADQATSWLLAEGYPADQVKAVVGGAATPAATKGKTLTEAIILETYEAGLSTQAQATEQLEAIGYEPGAIPVIIQSYDAKKILSAATTVITQIKKQFLAGQITSSVASSLLNEVGVQADIRDAYIRDWGVEAHVEIKTLTPAQLGDAGKKGIISSDYYASRMAALGYGADDIEILANYYGIVSSTLPLA